MRKWRKRKKERKRSPFGSQEHQSESEPIHFHVSSSALLGLELIGRHQALRVPINGRGCCLLQCCFPFFASAVPKTNFLARPLGLDARGFTELELSSLEGEPSSPQLFLCIHGCLTYPSSTAFTHTATERVSCKSMQCCATRRGRAWARPHGSPQVQLVWMLPCAKQQQPARQIGCAVDYQEGGIDYDVGIPLRLPHRQ